MRVIFDVVWLILKVVFTSTVAAAVQIAPLVVKFVSVVAAIIVAPL